MVMVARLNGFVNQKLVVWDEFRILHVVTNKVC
jgi:hypothetical protein